jgi:Fe-S cluster assembly iron-binding protein IscA
VLTVSPTAAEAISLLVENADVPDSGGLRIAAGEPTDQGTPLAISIVEAPEPDDEVISGPAATVFLEPQVAPYLESAVLDAHVNDGEIAFALHDSDAAQRPSGNGSGPQ